MGGQYTESAAGGTFDDIVVGAGSAGTVLAARLSADAGRRVLLLEAGPDYPDVAHTPAPLLDGCHLPSPSHDWGFTAELVPGRRGEFARGKVTGGSSAVNACLALRGMPADFDEWAAWGNDRWGWADVLPYFRRLEDDQDEQGAVHGRGGPTPIRRWRDAELAPMQRAFLAACRALGFSAAIDWNDPRASGVSCGAMNLRDGVRMSTAISYLLPARGRPNLTIGPECLVDRVLWDGGRAVGVALERAGVQEQVFGARITLAGGAIGSPAILLRSGIGPAQDLHRLGIDPKVDLPGVGANLIDHAMVGFGLSTTAGTVDETTPFAQVFLRYTAAGSAETNDMLAAIFQTAQQPSSWLFASVMRPRSRGTLRLADRDPHVQPEICLNLATDPEDRRRLVEALRLLCALARSPQVAACRTDDVALADGRMLPLAEAAALLSTPEVAEDYVRQTVGHFVHPVGTARMGPEGDAGAVVDQQCRVRGVEGLRVVDASVMPNIPRAPTNLTCIMLGERAADWLSAERG